MSLFGAWGFMPPCTPGFLFAAPLLLDGFWALLTEMLGFNKFAEAFARVVAVERLASGFLHFNVEASWGVDNVYTGGGSVDFLPAGAA